MLLYNSDDSYMVTMMVNYLNMV